MDSDLGSEFLLSWPKYEGRDIIYKVGRPQAGRHRVLVDNVGHYRQHPPRRRFWTQGPHQVVWVEGSQLIVPKVKEREAVGAGL